jgi:putative PIN family toxin of toxin-antitoxin system
VPDRVVIDTNVYISGLLWRGKPYQCLLLARARVFQAVYCRQMLAELSEKLRDKFSFSENRIQWVMQDVQRFAERIEITGQLHVVADDPDDDMFVECAVLGNVGYILSSDRHLINLSEYQGIRVVRPAEWMTRFERA